MLFQKIFVFYPASVMKGEGGGGGGGGGRECICHTKVSILLLVKVVL